CVAVLRVVSMNAMRDMVPWPMLHVLWNQIRITFLSQYAVNFFSHSLLEAIAGTVPPTVTSHRWTSRRHSSDWCRRPHKPPYVGMTRILCESSSRHHSNPDVQRLRRRRFVLSSRRRMFTFYVNVDDYSW
ncbi:hypothetical protein S245_065345, partial [Arachis hypogaea]